MNKKELIKYFANKYKYNRNVPEISEPEVLELEVGDAAIMSVELEELGAKEAIAYDLL